ncbi:RibD family protein [Thermosynechococcaceae cyanobacterium BACA0444]|uniref:RibD family protein n=1 Tax=Pseudocalidococcus azoricus BACA0444 TaxID=2918990 RepID=A0AAE4JWG4_9CYAN|nr:RibD family protein [Pseudocalidococcus azoricus]MDS3861345.1 RibD family protein [Pseudocalidococcus azoricus BACA0444]
MCQSRPWATVILAMSLDGKIAAARGPDQLFGSRHDYDHLEALVAQADGVIFGAATLRSGGTAMRVQREFLIQARLAQGKSAQPIQIVCSQSGKIDPNLRFFQQPIPRYLLTTKAGARAWLDQDNLDQDNFAQVLSPTTSDDQIDLVAAYEQLHGLGIKKLAVLGGGVLIASLLAAGLIDEWWVTLCPLVLGGTMAATPVAGLGFSVADAPRFQLVQSKQIGDELFLHYQVKSNKDGALTDSSANWSNT